MAYHDRSDQFLFIEHEDLYYPCISDLYIQLLLDMEWCFVVDLCDDNVVYGFSSAFIKCYLFLVLGFRLWFGAYNQSNKFFYVADFTEDLYRTSIADQSL